MESDSSTTSTSEDSEGIFYGSSEVVKAVVIDAGTATIRAGFADDDTPSVIIPPVVGRAKTPAGSSLEPGLKSIYVGTEAVSKRGVLDQLRNPIEHGLVTNWDDMELLWKHTFQELGVKSEGQPVLLTETERVPKADREKTVQIMFEQFETPSLNISTQSVLALYESGRTTGVVVHVGEGSSHTVPILEGHRIRHAILKMSVSGSDLTAYLSKLLTSHPENYGQDLRSYYTRELVRGYKEKMCYVALDFNNELSSAKSADSEQNLEGLEMPDGTEVTLTKSDRIKVPEALFDPTLCGYEEPGIHWSLHSSIHKLNCDIWLDLYRNIVLAGGSTLVPRLAARLEREVDKLAKAGKRHVKVVPATGLHTSWRGGTILASLTTFKDMYINREEYEEAGPGIVHRKCFE